MKHLKFAISPCPNDTFIFENIVNGTLKIEDHTISFDYFDIDVLNNYAKTGEYDVIKISFANLKNVTDQYIMLESGGALGYGVGPLLVKKKSSSNIIEDFALFTVAIPGIETTANFLLKRFFPQIKEDQKIVLPFDEIARWTEAEEGRLGVLIHESRFTYHLQDLELVNDLGQLWEQTYQLPIPLGCIMAKNSLGPEMHRIIENTISESITNYEPNGEPMISDYIRGLAQEMEEEVIKSHIRLYVNDFSIKMGESGKKAIALLGNL